MNIKQPLIVDVSHWHPISDFAVISPRPALFITKATEGISIVDTKFIPFFAGAKSVGFQRGAFHFFRKAQDSVRQAMHFCSVIRSHITERDYLILDVEEGGERASQLWAWLEHVRKEFPRNPRMIYGRKNLLDPIPMTAGERAYFTQIPMWTAGYPLFPDLWNTPMGYVPDQTKWGPVWLWQYSDHGEVTGIQGSVDLNMATAEFLPILYSGIDPDPTPLPEPEEEIMQYKFIPPTTVTNERTGASTTFPPTGRQYVPGNVVNVVEVLRINAFEEWGRLDNGRFVALMYSGVVRAELVPVTPPAPVTPFPFKVTGTSLTLHAVDEAGVKWQATIAVDMADAVEFVRE